MPTGVQQTERQASSTVKDACRPGCAESSVVTASRPNDEQVGRGGKMKQQPTERPAAVSNTISAETNLPDTATEHENAAAETGRRQMLRELAEHHAVSPTLTAGDVDADWQSAEATGEETPGGHAPTPDQDNVDEIGRAYGMELQDNQELRTHDEILGKRDANRWELNRSSADGETL